MAAIGALHLTHVSRGSKRQVVRLLVVPYSSKLQLIAERSSSKPNFPNTM
jgi:hypothetical protein